MRVWDLHRWRHDDVYESEDGESVRSLRVVNYRWGDPICWLDNETVAVGGIGQDDLAMIDGVEIYSAETGLRVGRIRLAAFALAVLLSAASVTLTGPIGFVGLVAPCEFTVLLSHVAGGWQGARRGRFRHLPKALRHGESA